MKILIYGAGVIGQIYAARLHEAGQDVTVLARHRTLETLARDGITLVNGALVSGATSGPVRVNVTGHVGPDSSFELALVTVRRDQVDEILPALAELQASHVVMMQNNSLELASVGDIVGRDRTLFGFPGVGGYRRDDGAIEYIEIPQQPTTLGRQQGREEIVGEVFKSAGFAVATTADMDGWLKTHAVFIAAICGSINSCGGDAVKLAADRERVATMIRSAGEGFRALTSKGVAVQPRPLRMIFTVVPRMFAVRYWQGQLRGTVGTVALAPHSKMTKDTELPVLYRDVQKLVGGTVPTPHLDKLLSLTPLLCFAASRAFSMVTSRGIRNDSLNRKQILQIGLVLFALTLLAAARSTSGLDLHGEHPRVGCGPDRRGKAGSRIPRSGTRSLRPGWSAGQLARRARGKACGMSS